MNQQRKDINSVYDSRDYKRSRVAYIAECAFEYFVALLVADAFLSNLLSYMGFDDATIGIISSLITFAFLFQLAAIFVVQRIRNVKKVAVTIHFISQLFFTALYLVPFLPFPKEYKTFVVIACVLVAYFGNYLVTTVIFKWGNLYVDPNKRGSYAALKEMVSLLSGTFVTLFMGFMIDRFAAADNVRGGFIFTAAMMLVMTICDFVCLLLMKNQEVKPAEKSDVVPFFVVIRKIFSNRSFLCVIFLTILWNVSSYILLGFMGIYKTKELGLSVGMIQLINIAGCLFRFAFSRPFGRYTDKHSYAKGMKLGIMVAALSFLANIFTTPSLWWMVIVYTILYNVSAAGISQNLWNIVYNFVEPEYFVQASAIKNSIGGICGFLASLAGGAILSAVQRNGNEIAGVTIYAQQLLSIISLLFAVVCILYIHFVLEKQEVRAK